jgi:holo-[acyl-carrier protein] synthase
MGAAARADPAKKGVINAPVAPRLRSAVGVDLVRVSEVAESIQRFGDRYLRRVFTDREISQCMQRERCAERLAARFAAKEAIIKILRPNGHGFDWRCLEVDTTPGGWTEIVLHGKAAEHAAERGAFSWSSSLSHDGDLAVAVVSCLTTK